MLSTNDNNCIPLELPMILKGRRTNKMFQVTEDKQRREAKNSLRI